MARKLSVKSVNTRKAQLSEKLSGLKDGEIITLYRKAVATGERGAFDYLSVLQKRGVLV